MEIKWHVYTKLQDSGFDISVLSNHTETIFSYEGDDFTKGFDSSSDPFNVELLGNYIIWANLSLTDEQGKPENSGIAIYTGSGNIKTELTSISQDPRIRHARNMITDMKAIPHLNGLAWTEHIEEEAVRKGIEKYLRERLTPIIDYKYPNIPPLNVESIPVDLPLSGIRWIN